MVGTQLTIVWWKRTYFKSYQTVTLIGMWFIPPYFGYELGWDAFMFIWLVYSIATAFVTWTASQKPVAPNVPRKVYTYFTVFYKVNWFIDGAIWLLFRSPVKLYPTDTVRLFLTPR